MKNKLLIGLALLGLSTPAFAQMPDSSAAKNHFGIMARPRLEKIFTANQTLPVGIIYKRQVKPDQALRISVMGSYFKENHVNNYSYNYPAQLDIESTSLDYQVLAGYEWQKQLNKKWGFYYGADLGISKSSSKVKPTSIQKTPTYPYYFEPQFWDSKTNSLLLQPFAGFSLHISSRLYFAAETSVSFSKSNNEAVLNKYILNYDNNEIKAEQVDKLKNDYFKVWYRPISNIQLVYKF